jgi:hypothetical protein
VRCAHLRNAAEQNSAMPGSSGTSTTRSDGARANAGTIGAAEIAHGECTVLDRDLGVAARDERVA